MIAVPSITRRATVVPDVHRFRICSVARMLERDIDKDARRFRLRRDIDHSHVSGTGDVAEGIEFPSGLILMWWTVPGKPSTCTLLSSRSDIDTLHGHGGDTVIEWVTDTVEGGAGDVE